MQQLTVVPSSVLGEEMETHMKFTLPGMLITALVVASPAALAQGNMGYSGSSSNPATSVSKDETSGTNTQRPKKHMTSHKHKRHMASYKQRHHANKARAQTTGSGSSSPKKY